MTTQQIVWASKHDWFIEAKVLRITGQIRIHVKDGMVAGNTLGFTDFEELKQWAGY
tara:strand:+ start:467 stop:634 length:168 start_codon:yes stop_codon:yes gene_type:complete